MREDLELISGKVFIASGGSSTRLLYEILKELPKEDLKGLLELESMTSMDNLKQMIKKGEELLNVTYNDTSTHREQENNSGPSFTQWLSNKRQL